MLYRKLTPDILVSELCFGTLTLGPLQKGLTPALGGRLLAYAMEQGITFFDTAELYDNYAHLREALRLWKGQVVIASKSYAYDKDTMDASIEKARSELNRDYIDIFLLHEQESEHTMRGHAEALEYLCEAKQKGLVRAAGVSTHYVAGVKAAARHPEVDVIHPLINMCGIGIPDGSAEDMAQAIKEALNCSKAVYGMKALAGGSLYLKAREAIDFVRKLPGVTAVAIGMGSRADIDANVGLFNYGEFPRNYLPHSIPRRVIVEPWCEGCGACKDACPTQCITIKQGRAEIDSTKCLLCGYCVAHCKDFYLKVI